MDTPSPTLIDNRYRIGKPIGTGGMGCVYEAVHVGIGRRVALKTLRKDIELNTRAFARLQREARIAGSIGHDHICEVTDTGTMADGLPYLVMPLLEGRTLKAVLKEEAPLDASRSLEIVRQVLNALDAAHERRVVHRDLKPANVFLVETDRRRDFVKILDFGISKRLDLSESTKLTLSGAVMGTPMYMSPEQACGASEIDHRADIYAAGLLLYEMLTAHRPFEGDTYNEVITKIVGAPFAAPMAINPAISKPLNRIVLKAMARNPEDRYATAREMRDAIDDLSPENHRQRRSEPTLDAANSHTPFSYTPNPIVAPPRNYRTKAVAVVAALLSAAGGFALGFLTAEEPARQEAVAGEDAPTGTVTISPKTDIPVVEATSTKPSPPPEVTVPVTEPLAPETSVSNRPVPSAAPRSRARKHRPKPSPPKAPAASPVAKTFSGDKNTLFVEDYAQ